MLEFKLDSPTDRLRKRRSSRTSALGSRDPWANTLLFRDAQDERNTIHDWNSRINPHLVRDAVDRAGDDGTASPEGTSTTSFTNPFAQRGSRAANSSPTSRPDYQRGASTPAVNASTYPHAPRERPAALISPSPSLRSRRSDLSSQASSHHPQVGFSPHLNYSANVPSDLPSPASTSGYDAQFVEGWTAAQGRSSALSSHTRGSNSIASVVPPPIIGSTPPGPRETILDRAFQMRYIPGSDRVPGKEDEKISSIARFEALMREADERKRQKAVAQHEAPVKSSFDLDEESEESSVESAEDDDDEDDNDGLNIISMRSPAQRALDYISGRTTPLPSSRPLSPASTRSPRSPPVPFNRSISDYRDPPIYRPRTGTTSNTTTAPSTSTSRRPSSLATASRSISSTAIPGLQHDWSHGAPAPDAPPLPMDSLRRRSTAGSAKRLSFQEFAKRLSSTSSLLLVQTNTSSRASTDDDDDDVVNVGAEEREREARRSCRAPVGVFSGGGEGGFL